VELKTLMVAASALVEQVLKLLHPLWGCQVHQGSTFACVLRVLGLSCFSVDLVFLLVCPCFSLWITI